MLDDATVGATVPAPRCTWCSAELPSNHETVCPSCGATLLGDGETQVPGLTAIDAEAILRNARAAKAKPRSRLMSWISGDYIEDEGAAAPTPGSLAPPPVEVRREILRLELEAQVANAQAEVEAMAADAAVEEGDALDHVDASEPESADASEADGAGAPDAAGAAETSNAPETVAAADGDAPGSEPDSHESPPA
jgi:hypothetical protein